MCLQVYLKLGEKEEDPSWIWAQFGDHRQNTVRWARKSLDAIMSSDVENGHLYGAPPEVPIEIRAAYRLYKDKVGMKLAGAFRNDVKQPHMETLVEVATICGFKGTPNDVLTALAPHMTREKERVERYVNWLVKEKIGNDAVHTESLLAKKLEKASNMLLRSEERIKKQFEKAMPKSMLPTPVAVAAPAAPAPALMPPPSATMAITASPPVAAPPTAPLLALMPPTPPSVDDYLRDHIRPRADCAKCVVARGPDATVRSLFASEGGKGRSRNISAKRACPLAAHAISAPLDGVPLLEKYESDYGVKLTNKRQKFNDFMQNAYGVERLGQAPTYKVTLYTPPHVDASLTLQGGDIKLSLSAFGYEATSEQGTKENYMGFQIV
jgi:hypothetical protein